MSGELSVAVIGASAVIIAALISFFVAVTSAVISKEQKISEFRQVWIEKLREDIAEIVALSYSFTSVKEKVKFYGGLIYEEYEGDVQSYLHESNVEQGNLSIEIMVEILKKSSLVRLRLNPKENKPLLDSIEYLIDGLLHKSITTKTSINDINKVQDLSYEVLKSEWEKVKKGGKRYILFVSVGEFFVGALIIAFFVLLYLAKFPEYFPGIN